MNESTQKREEIEAKIEAVFDKYHKMGIDKYLEDAHGGNTKFFDFNFNTLLALGDFDKMIFKSIPVDIAYKNVISIGKNYPFKEEFLNEAYPLYLELAEVCVYKFRKLPDCNGLAWVNQSDTQTTIAIKPRCAKVA